MSPPTPEDPARTPDVPSQRQTLPIARRLAARGAGFPLLWRPGAKSVRLPMVGWFDPAQLLTTGAKTLAALVVGERSDPRIVQAIAARETGFYDYTVHYVDGAAGPAPDGEHPREEIWIDYVCDTGDGWNPVYAVAYAVSLRLTRLHVGRDGMLTVYPVKIERVPRRWRARGPGEPTPSRVVPDEPLRAELIEPPIVVPGRR